MRMRLLATAAVLGMCHAATISAQAPHTAEAVRSAMMARLQSEAKGADHPRIAFDSAAVWRDFVSCTIVNGASVCSLSEGKPVTVIHVTMVTPDSAEVRLQHFRMVDRMCPYGRPIVRPIITGALHGTSWWTMRYVGGTWVGTKRDLVVTC